MLERTLCLASSRYMPSPRSRPLTRRGIGRPLSHGLACICAAITQLVGCGSAIQVVTGKVAEIALSSVGLTTADNAKSTHQPKGMSVRIEASRDLNAGEDGRGLSTVVRLYQLRDRNNFLAAPYSVFGNADREKQAIGSDLVSVRELTLSPGQALAIKDQLSGEAQYFGVVALFRSPAPQRWRFAFAAAEFDQSGLVLGAHACALTSTNARPLGSGANENALLSNVTCN